MTRETQGNVLDNESLCPEVTDKTDLWCAHLPGDDVIPTVNADEAAQIVARVNGVLKWANDMEPSPFNAEPSGHVCPWPWSARAHMASKMTFASWELREEVED